MTAELTAEEIVTNLLSSHEILKSKKTFLGITSPANLGEYLENLPVENFVPELIEEEISRFSFIKNCHNKWN